MDEETTLVEYRTEQDGDKFVAFDSTGELVGAYDSEEQARTDVERAKLADAMYKHSKILFHAALASVMSSFDVDRDTARYWVSTAAEAN